MYCPLFSLVLQPLYLICPLQQFELLRFTPPNWTLRVSTFAVPLKRKKLSSKFQKVLIGLSKGLVLSTLQRL